MSIENTVVTVIIVTHNSSKFIERCLKSLVQNSSDFDRLSVIIVDNASSDDTVKKVRNYKGLSLDLICQNENVGFAKGVNEGLKKGAKSDIYIILNPDTEVQEGSIKEIVSGIKNNHAGICGGKTEGFSGEKQGDHFRTINIMTGIFDFTNLRKVAPNDYWHKRFYYQDKPNVQTGCIQVDGVSGCYMGIADWAIREIGYLDENFFMYLEDMDYCLRAKKLGIKVMYSPRAKLKHFGGGSSSNITRSNSNAWVQSRKYYFYKNFNAIVNIIIQPLFLLDTIYINLRNISKHETINS